MADIQLSKGEKGFNLGGTWLKSNGEPEDLTGYTLALKAWVRGTPGTLKMNGSCSIVSATAGTFTYTVVEADTAAVADEWDAKIEATKTGVIKKTKPFTISVTESG